MANCMLEATARFSVAPARDGDFEGGLQAVCRAALTSRRSRRRSMGWMGMSVAVSVNPDGRCWRLGIREKIWLGLADLDRLMKTELCARMGG